MFIRREEDRSIKLVSYWYVHLVSHTYNFLLFFYNPHLGYKEEEFSWPSYLKACKAQAAPKSLFENQNAVSTHLLLMV